VPYLTGDTVVENLAAGAYNLIPTINNSIGKIFEPVHYWINQTGDSVSENFGDRNLGEGFKNAATFFVFMECPEGGAKKPIVVTKQLIRNALKDSPIMTRQTDVSISLIQEYVRLLEAGSAAPAIEIGEDLELIDGHHRYIAGRIFGEAPKQIPWEPYPLNPAELKPLRPIQKIKTRP
jgi:hypothetical protein